MLSTMEKDLVFNNGVASLAPKEYPNWYGIEDIGFIWHGAWSDPEIEYNGKRINLTIVEDTMWERFREYCKENNWSADEKLSDFVPYMKENADDVYELIEIAFGGGC